MPNTFVNVLKKSTKDFAQYVGTLKPKEEVLHLYEEVLKDLHGDGKREIQVEIDKLKKKLRLSNLRLKKQKTC